jgi:hypothetical protein
VDTAALGITLWTGKLSPGPQVPRLPPALDQIFDLLTVSTTRVDEYSKRSLRKEKRIRE